MNNYNVLSKLGSGAQGSVHLVEDKSTKELCVVKKVECEDQTEASKAFDEGIALKELQHPYICGYKELFVVWEPKEAAIYVCIVMDYYKLGDLHQTLRSRHTRGDMLGDEELMKWVGQMVEALVYIHEKKLIHRDLKPSNIFLKDDMSLAIGDFGVSTMMMGTSKDVTRTTVGSINWMAPEILLDMKPHYDERSDVWSLGCVVLSMALCGLKDSQATGALLFDLKTNIQALEDVLVTVNQRYSPELCQFIRTTLHRGYEQRPTSEELSQHPYVQKCFALYGSPLYSQQPIDVGVDEERPAPTTGGVAALVEYMRENRGNEVCQFRALKQLQLLDEITVDDEGKKQLLVAMTTFKDSLQIQTLCCQVLSNIVATVELQEGDVLFSEEFIMPVCLAIRSHTSCRDLCAAVCTLLMVLASDESAADVIGRFGGIQDLISAMDHFPLDLEIISDCCTTLWSLAVIDDNMKIMTKEGCVKDVYKAMATHCDCRELVDAACSAMWSLSSDAGNLSLMADCGVVDLFLGILRKHMEDAGVVKLVCSTLSSLVKVHEVSAFHMIQTGSGRDGISIIKEVLHSYASNAEVVGKIVSLLANMAIYDQVRKELVSLKIQDLLSKLGERYSASPNGSLPQQPNDSDVSLAIKKALQALAPPKGSQSYNTGKLPSITEGNIA